MMSSLNQASEVVEPRVIDASGPLGSGDQGTFVEVDSAGAVVLTIDEDLPIGWSTAVVRIGTGTVSFAAAGGGSIVSTVGASPSIGSQYGGATIYHRGSGVFVIQGNLA